MTQKKGWHGGQKLRNWFLRLSLKKRIAVCTAGVCLCLLASGVIFVAAKLIKLDSEDLDSDKIVVNESAEEVGEGYTTVALFGIDSRAGELERGTRTDCIIVASLNNKTKEVRMASVYRDTLLDIEDGRLQKCNAAYSYGGPTQAISMLNKNLDLNIQDYATVDFSAIANAIDLLGGIEIEIQPEEIKPLNKYVSETARVAGKKANKVQEAGLQHLDGVQATTYARIRSTAGGDFTRTERQRLVIEKIVEKVQKTDLGTVNQIIDEILPTIKTSFSATEILSYAKDFMKYKISDSTGFPFDKTTDTISGLGSIVIPVTLESNVEQLHEFLYEREIYAVSEQVKAISEAVIARVGQRDAVDDSTLRQQTYTPSAEDQEQEKQPESTSTGSTTTPSQSGANDEPSTDTGDGTSGTHPGGATEDSEGTDSGTTGDNEQDHTKPPSDAGGEAEVPDSGGETEPPEDSGDSETGGVSEEE